MIHLNSSVLKRSTVVCAAALGVLLLLSGCSERARRERALGRAEESFRAGDFEKARLEYQGVLAKFPDDPAANARLAVIWNGRGASVRALHYVLKALRQDATNSDLLLLRARTLRQLGATGDARADVRTMLARRPGWGEALLLQAELVRSVEELRQTDKDLKDARDKVSPAYQLAVARTEWNKGDREKALAAARKALAFDSHAAQARLILAGVYLEQGKSADSLRELQAALKIAPLNSLERVQAALLLARRTTPGDAVPLLEETTRKFPEFLPAWNALAELAFRQAKFDEARKLLEGVMQRDPANYEARLQLAAIASRTGSNQQAIAELEKIGREFPGFVLEKTPLARAYLSENDVPRAISTLQEVVTRTPDNHEAMLLLGELQLRTQAYEPATRTLHTLLYRRPDLLPVYPLLVEAARKAGQLETIVAGINGSAKEKPVSHLQLYTAGPAPVALPQPDAATAAGTNEAAVNNPGSYLQSLSDGLAPITLPKPDEAAAAGTKEAAAQKSGSFLQSYFLGLAQVALQRLDEARTHFERALELAPDFIPAVEELAGLDLRERKFEALSDRGARMIEQGREVSLAHFMVARARAEQLRWPDAIAAARRGLAAQSDPAKVRPLMYQLLRATREKATAVELLRAALARFPDDAMFALMAGSYFVQAKQPAEARQVYEDLLARVPNAILVLNNLANLELETPGRMDRALELARRAHDLDPLNGVVADSLAWILFRSGKAEEALPHAETACRNAPGAGEHHYHLGAILQALGRNEPALAALRKAAAARENFEGKAEAARRVAELEREGSPAAKK